ncbi:MAG: DUF6368 family protein [Acidiferrobacterales bacterium]|nr:DUF6368 family protein [Acidiferrobacterales bacterium]
MAGPCSRIFIPRKISSSDESRVRSVIDSIASKVEGSDFWIAGRPFFVDFDEPEEDERDLVLDGWRPEGVVSFCAMCNDQCDHVFLAMLCYRTAELLEGLIALDDISTITRDPSVLTFDGRRPIKGYGYIVHSQFLGYWMSHPDFRLVK